MALIVTAVAGTAPAGNSITLTKVWVSLAATPSVSVSFFSAGRGDTRQTLGAVRPYANGRLRAISRSVSQQRLTITGRALTATQLASLDGWRGQIVLVRDVWGRKLYGTFFDLSVADYAAPNTYQDVTFNVDQVTFIEAV